MGISVAPYGPPLVSTKNRSKPWKPPVTHSSTATATTLRIMGTLIGRNSAHSPAPSRRAASTTSAGICRNAA